MNNSIKLGGLLVVLVASLYLAGALTAVLAQPPTSEPAMEEAEVGTGLCGFKSIAHLTPLRPVGCGRGCEMFLLNVDMHSYQNLGVMCADDTVFFMTQDQENRVHLIIVRDTLSAGWHLFVFTGQTHFKAGTVEISGSTSFGSVEPAFPRRFSGSWTYAMLRYLVANDVGNVGYVDLILEPLSGPPGGSVWFHCLEICYLGR